MCEFSVLLDGEKVQGDVTFVKIENGATTIWDIIGQIKRYENVEIIEVNTAEKTLKMRNLDPECDS